MSLIQMNYDVAIAQARRLEQAAEDCRTMANDVNTQIAALSEAWKGNAADAMIEKLTSWSKDTAEMETRLNALAQRIRKKADALLAADEAANRNTAASGSEAGQTAAKTAAAIGAQAAAAAAKALHF